MICICSRNHKPSGDIRNNCIAQNTFLEGNIVLFQRYYLALDGHDDLNITLVKYQLWIQERKG
jgi:hypothetical protein